MADKQIQLRRYNGTGWDNLFPKTKLGMVEGLINSTDNKINASLLPSYVLGSLRYVGALSSGSNASMTLKDVYDNAFALGEPTTADPNNDLYRGSFVIASAETKITNIGVEANNTVYLTLYGEEDDTEVPTTMTLESGDWLVYRGCKKVGTVTSHYFDVINNTYQDADTTNKGIVKLASSVTSNDSTNAATPSSVYSFVNSGYADKGSAISSLSVSGRAITFTKANGGTGTITTQDTVYTHPSYTANASGLYKFSNDNKGHITGVTSVAKADITALGIPAQDTTYTAGAGLTLSGTQFSINNSITAGSKGLTDDSAPSFGGTFKVPYITYNAKGLITAANEYSVQLPSTTASASANGLMTSTNYKSLTNLCRSVISANPTSATTGDICVVEIS